MFVIIEKDSMAMAKTVLASRPNVNYFDKARTAKGWLTKMENVGKLEMYIDGKRTKVKKDRFIVMDVKEYSAVEPMIEMTNMMTGEKYKESINTPNYCSPSSESYWSM